MILMAHEMVSLIEANQVLGLGSIQRDAAWETPVYHFEHYDAGKLN